MHPSPSSKAITFSQDLILSRLSTKIFKPNMSTDKTMSTKAMPYDDDALLDDESMASDESSVAETSLAKNETRVVSKLRLCLLLLLVALALLVSLLSYFMGRMAEREDFEQAMESHAAKVRCCC